MASSTTSILALALFFIATATHAHALLTINGQNVLGLQVNGTLACSATGNLPGPDRPCNQVARIGGKKHSSIYDPRSMIL